MGVGSQFHRNLQILQSITGLINHDIDRIGIAEKIMHIAQNLLVGTDEKDADLVRLIGSKLVEQQRALAVARA